MGKTLLYSVWGLALVSLTALLLTQEIGLLVSLTTIAWLSVTFYWERKGALKKIIWLENVAILLLFSAAVSQFLLTKTSFLMIVAHFLIGFTLLKLSLQKTRNDLIQIIALSFFLLLSASTLALDFSYIMSFILYVLTATWTLSLYSLTAEENQKEQSLNIKRIFRSIVWNCGLTLCLVLFFSLSIFVFFPRISLAVFQGAFLGPAQKSGISEKMNLIQHGKIFEDPAIAMRVEIPDDQKNRIHRGYLRGQTLSQFDGIEWSATEKKGKVNVQDSSRSRILNIQKVVKNQFQVLAQNKEELKEEFSLKLNEQSTLTQKIYLESLDNTLLFGIPWVDQVSARLSQILILEDDAILRPSNFSGRMIYEVRSLVERPSEKALAKIPSTDLSSPEEQESLSKYLQVPDLDFSRVRELLQRIVSRKDNPYIKAKKIETYLNKNHHYSLQIKTNNLSNPIEEFLFETKEGHCEYFASAMALMLRLENVPCRIVTGYLMTEWNPSGNYYVVRSKDAHSWVEVSLNGLWIEFDPSPRFYVPDMETMSWRKQMKQNLDYWNFLWNAYVLGYDMESQKKLAKAMELKSGQLSSHMDRIVNKWRSRWQMGRIQLRRGQKGISFPGLLETRKSLWGFSLVLAGILIAGLGLYEIFRRYGLSRNVKFRVLNKYSFYDKMLTYLSKQGWNKKPSETPYEFLRRLDSRFRGNDDVKSRNDGVKDGNDDVLQQPLKGQEELVDIVQSLTDLYYPARYSQTKTSKEDLLQTNLLLQRLRDL